MSPPDERSQEHGRRRLQDLQDILDAAASLFAQYGFSGTSMKQIADRAEFSVGKLYRYFDGKDAIYAELRARHIDALRARCALADEVGGDPLSRLRQRLHALASYFLENPSFLFLYVRDHTLRSDDPLQSLRRHQEHVAAELLGEAMRRGELRSSDERVLAVLLLGALERLMVWLTLEVADRTPERVTDALESFILAPLLGTRGPD